MKDVNSCYFGGVVYSEAVEKGTRAFLCIFRTCKQPIQCHSHRYNGAQRIWLHVLLSMSPNRAAKSLEILNLIAVKAITNVVAGSRSQSEAAAFRNPVAFEMEISMWRIFC